jgi:hypothetical protein
MKRADDERVAGWIMRNTTPLAVLTQFTLEIVQEKGTRRRKYVPSLKQFKGSCDGFLLSTASQLTTPVEPAIIVLIWAADHACLFGPAYLDCSIKGSRFQAIFVPAGEWQRSPLTRARDAILR